MKPTLFALIIFFFATSVHAQYPEFGKLKTWEKNLNVYEKDPTASAIVLFERGDVYFEVIDNYIFLKKKFHSRIKVLDQKGVGYGNISIPIYFSSTQSEKIEDLKAVTHNDMVQQGVSPQEVYKVDTGTNTAEMRFTFPNVQVGSILEYSYTLVSPFYYKLEGWTFQSNIPKVYSEFNARIPRNYSYNRSLVGELELSTNESYVETRCFQLPEPWEPADCEFLTYAMKNVPAFVEEDFMLAPKNFISRVEFELSEYFTIDRIRKKYTKSWKDVDRDFAKSDQIGGQLTKGGFFKSNLPGEILGETNTLTKANKIFEYVKKHFTWTGKSGLHDAIGVKNAFQLKRGSIAEINIALINFLNTAGIEAHPMLTSTRKNGLPKKEHPVILDFNYLIAKATVDGKDVLLDATEKQNPFGMLPYRCLNYYGRVMDFKKGSYWHDIVPEKKNNTTFRVQMKLNTEENKAVGIFDEINMGYPAVDRRKRIEGVNEASYLEYRQDQLDDDVDLTTYRLFKERNHDKLVSERFGFEIEEPLDGETLFLNPFVAFFFENNPFQLENRTYPVDFGYPRSYTYQANIDVPENYVISSMPEKQTFDIEGNMGRLKLNHQVSQDKVIISFNLNINSTYFGSEKYASLKELLAKTIEIQRNSLIVFKKKGS